MPGRLELERGSRQAGHDEAGERSAGSSFILNHGRALEALGEGNGDALYGVK